MAVFASSDGSLDDEETTDSDGQRDIGGVSRPSDTRSTNQSTEEAELRSTSNQDMRSSVGVNTQKTIAAEQQAQQTDRRAKAAVNEQASNSSEQGSAGTEQADRSSSTSSGGQRVDAPGTESGIQGPSRPTSGGTSTTNEQSQTTTADGQNVQAPGSGGTGTGTQDNTADVEDTMQPGSGQGGYVGPGTDSPTDPTDTSEQPPGQPPDSGDGDDKTGGGTGIGPGETVNDVSGGPNAPEPVTSGDGYPDRTTVTSSDFQDAPVTQDGDALVGVAQQLGDEYGQQDFKFAAVDGGLVAKFESDSGTQYVPIPTTEGDGANSVASVAEELQSREVAESLGVSTADVSFSESGELQLSESAKEDFGQSQLASQLGQDVAQSLEIGEDFEVERSDGGIQVTLTTESSEAAQNAALQGEFGPSAIIEQLGDGAYQVTTQPADNMSGHADAPESTTEVVAFNEEGQAFLEDLQSYRDEQAALAEDIVRENFLEERADLREDMEALSGERENLYRAAVQEAVAEAQGQGPTFIDTEDAESDAERRAEGAALLFGKQQNSGFNPASDTEGGEFTVTESVEPGEFGAETATTTDRPVGQVTVATGPDGSLLGEDDAGGPFSDFYEGVTSAPGDLYDSAASKLDFAAMTFDEAVGRAVHEASQGDIVGAINATTPFDEQVPGLLRAGNRVGVNVLDNSETVVRELQQFDIAGALDATGGNTDEWFGRNVEQYDQGLDVLAGSTDEAVGRAIHAGASGNVAGVLDHLSGGTDEAVGRSIYEASQGDLDAAGDNLAGGIDDFALDVARYGPGVLDGVAGYTDEAVGRGIYELSQGDLDAAGDAFAGPLDEQVPGVLRAQRRAAQELRQGDIAGALDESAGQMDESFDRVARAFTGTETAVEFNNVLVDEAFGSVDEQFQGGFQTEAVSKATGSGGFLSEEDEAALAETAEEFNSDVGATSSALSRGISAVDNNGWVAPAVGAGTNVLGEAVNVFQYANLAESGVELTSNIDDESASALAKSGAAAAGAIPAAMYADAVTNPVRFAAGGTVGYLTGAKAGQLAGKLGRGVTTRLKTVGATKIDAEDLAPEDVVKQAEGGDTGEDFPGAEDPDTYQSDPAQAVREQAEDYTPDEVREFYEEQGIEKGSLMKKALGVEPEGPGYGKGGFESPDVGDGGFDYESPGSFFGPNLSPYFLDIGSAEYSLRPGLPSLGNAPTGVFAKLDVENTDASDLDEFNEELVDSAGDSTAYTKPASEVATGEIEAVVPPGARFSAVRSGRIRDIAHSLGIGSEFYTEIDGTRIPLRTVAPEGAGSGTTDDIVDSADEVADEVDDGFDIDAEDMSTEGDSGRPLEYYVEAGERGVDRPLPLDMLPSFDEDPTETISESSYSDESESRLYDESPSAAAASSVVEESDYSEFESVTEFFEESSTSEFSDSVSSVNEELSVGSEYESPYSDFESFGSFSSSSSGSEGGSGGGPSSVSDPGSGSPSSPPEDSDRRRRRDLDFDEENDEDEFLLEEVGVVESGFDTGIADVEDLENRDIDALSSDDGGFDPFDDEADTTIGVDEEALEEQFSEDESSAPPF